MSLVISLTQLSTFTFPQKGQNRVLQENGTRCSLAQTDQGGQIDSPGKYIEHIRLQGRGITLNA